MNAPETIALPAVNLGKLIDARADAYAHVKQLEKTVKDAKAVVDSLDEQIMAAMDEQDMPRASGHKATMSITESVVPNVKDWDSLYQFINEHGYNHLLNRAPNAAAFRELFGRGDPVPGVEAFTKRSLHFTKT